MYSFDEYTPESGDILYANTAFYFSILIIKSVSARLLSFIFIMSFWLYFLSSPILCCSVHIIVLFSPSIKFFFAKNKNATTVWLICLVGRVFANGLGDLGSILGQVIPKTLKMVLDTSLLNIKQYKVCIKGKVKQSWERSSALHYTLV